jgi:hypothetical protein
MSIVAAETTPPKAQAGHPGFVQPSTRHDATSLAAWCTSLRDSIVPLVTLSSEWIFFVRSSGYFSWRAVDASVVHAS